MPETKQKATARAKRLGFSKSQVTKGKRGYYIAPKGIRTSTGKKTYAGLRSKGTSKARAAKIAWTTERKSRRRRK